ncbi:MAG TPA: hypothetical protein VLM17_09960 [Xanthomonadaceae bacterium]|nr:hypothetical protein [Xanthomonadaceae bacterium]
MALLDCPECKREYSDQAAACVHCGARNPAHRKPTPLILKLLLGIVVLFVTFIGLGLVLEMADPTSGQRNDDRSAIEYCESEYARLEDDPRMTRGALGLAYGACEKLKDDFRRKWNREP